MNAGNENQLLEKLSGLITRARVSIKKQHIDGLEPFYYDVDKKTKIPYIYVSDGHYIFATSHNVDKYLPEQYSEVPPAIRDGIRKFSGKESINLWELNLTKETVQIGEYWYDTRLVKLIMKTMGKRGTYTYIDEEYRGIVGATSMYGEMVILSLKKGAKELGVN